MENRPPVPFSVIALASYLRKNKVPVEVLDTRVQPYLHIDFNSYSLVGISAKTGEQISFAVELCKLIRSKSKVKIVWGGCHASFFPEQTCKSDLVDFVIKGEGEETLLKLAKALDSNNHLEMIHGLVYKKDGHVISNKDRCFLNMDTLDIPAYDLVDMEKYQDMIGYFTIETSRGCPFRCDFCYAHNFHKQKWRYKSIPKVITEIKQIIKSYNVNKFFFCDDNFFVDKNRVMNFCKALLKQNIKIKIHCYGRANYFARYSIMELKLLKDAGFFLLGIGAESGSQKVLDQIHKDIKVNDILNSAKKCVTCGMSPFYSFVIGMPGEGREDLEKTIDLFFKLKEVSSKVEVNGFYIFTPYPGTPIYEKAIKLGYKPFDSLEGWASWKFSDISNLVWLNNKERSRLQVLSKIILFLFLKDRFSSYGGLFKKEKLGSWFNRLVWNLGSYVLGFDAMFRLKNRLFNYGYEWLLFGYVAREKFKVV